MGLPASGKSRLAREWAGKHQFSYFNFEVVRRQLAGHAADIDADAIHANRQIRRTYTGLLTFMEQELANGRTVVVDAFYGAAAERARLGELAEKMQIKPHFVLCYCSEKTSRRRLAERTTGNKAAADDRWTHFKNQQENVDALDDLDQTMVVSINTDIAHDQLLDQLDYAFGKRAPITVVSQ
jgi:predicted kinase